jgi:hypothetical protein
VTARKLSFLSCFFVPVDWCVNPALFNLLLLLPLAHLNDSAWHLAAIAFTIQVLAIVFSHAGPVPIDNRIAKWTPASVPGDRKAQERRWDIYHSIRICGLVVALTLVVPGMGVGD